MADKKREIKKTIKHKITQFLVNTKASDLPTYLTTYKKRYINLAKGYYEFLEYAQP